MLEMLGARIRPINLCALMPFSSAAGLLGGLCGMARSGRGARLFFRLCPVSPLDGGAQAAGGLAGGLPLAALPSCVCTMT
jgi:hypothetical protein